MCVRERERKRDSERERERETEPTQEPAAADLKKTNLYNETRNPSPCGIYEITVLTLPPQTLFFLFMFFWVLCNYVCVM